MGVWAKGAAFFRRYWKRLWSALGLVLASLLGGPLGRALSAFEHVRTVNDALTWVHDKLDPVTKLLAPAVALIPPWFVANWFAIGCFTLATLLVLAVVIQYFLDERALRQSGVAVGAAESEHVIAPESEPTTPPEPLRPLSNAWDSAPGVPEARAAKLSERLFHFVARRNNDHPLGILAPTMQGRGHFAEVNPASFLATPEGLASGKRYDADTLALYNAHYAEDVRAKRFAINNFQTPPDPTKDAIILEGPTCVSDIKLIARYLHELVIAHDASAGKHDVGAAPAAARQPILRPPRPSAGKLTVYVVDENGGAVDQAMVSIISEQSGAPPPEQMKLTGADGAAAFEASRGRTYTVLVGHAAFPGVVKSSVDGDLGVLGVSLQPRDHVASLVITHAAGYIPELKQHRFNPHDGGDHPHSVHIDGLSVGKIPAYPAPFHINETLELSDLNGLVVSVRFLFIKGEVSLLDYWWPSPEPPKPDNTLRTLREVRAHSRADIRRRTDKIVSQISVLTGEYHDASFRAEYVAPDLDGPLRDEATRIRGLFVDDLLEPVQKLAAEYARLSVRDEGLDEILNRTSFIRRIPTIDDIIEIEKRLALLPDKLDELE